MNLLVIVGYRKFVIPNATAPVVDCLLNSKTCEVGYFEGREFYYTDDGEIKIEVIGHDKMPNMTRDEYLEMRAEANGDQNSVE